MIRAILTYIQKKAKESGNSVLQYLACCCACCFWCLENCIRYINKNAYVQVRKRTPSIFFFCCHCTARLRCRRSALGTPAPESLARSRDPPLPSPSCQSQR